MLLFLRLPAYLSNGSFRGKLGDNGADILLNLVLTGVMSLQESNLMFNLAQLHARTPSKPWFGEMDVLWYEREKRAQALGIASR